MNRGHQSNLDSESNEVENFFQDADGQYVDVDVDVRMRSRSRASSVSSKRGRSASRLSTASKISTISRVSTSSRISTTSRQSTSSRISKFVREKIFRHIDDKIALQEAYEENQRLSKEIKVLKRELKSNEEIMVSIEKIETLYKSKLETLDQQGNITCYISKSNVQVGNENVLKTVDVSKLNDLLCSYHDNVQSLVTSSQNTEQKLKNTEKSFSSTKAKLDKTAEELQQTRDNLEEVTNDLKLARSKLEETGEKLESGTLLLKEVTEDLKDIKEDGTDRSLKLEYTIGLAQSKLMVNCIEALKTLKIQENKYLFSDLPEKGKLGVMRILRKYCQKDPKLTSTQFAEGLGVDTDAIENNTEELDQDTCSWILVKWVQKSHGNDADALCNKFIKLNQYGSVRGTLGSMAYDVSVSRFSLLDADGHINELLGEMKAITKGVHSCKMGIQSVDKNLCGLKNTLAPYQPMQSDTENMYFGWTCTR